MGPPGSSKSLSDPQEDGTRRHLQLEAFENTRAILESENSWGRATAFPNAEVSVIPPCLATASVSQAESVATSGNMNITLLRNFYGYPPSGIPHWSSTSPETHMSVLNGKSFPVIARSLPGTGLHLRTIRSTQVPEDDGMRVLGETPLSGHAYRRPDSSISYQYPVDTEAPLISSPLPNHIHANQDDIKSMACPPNKNSTASEHADGVTESAQISTSNKMQAKKPSGKEDSQRCSCAKSNCLKRYCGCFSSGSFCGEHCQCQDCYNKSEHEDVVSEAKEHIKSRVPYAFAPKIIRPVTISGESTTMITPSGSLRMGCNCRKSLCRKNYCECFKARVGCSSACRCEDCKNAFGVKCDSEYWTDRSFQYGRMTSRILAHIILD